MLDSGGWNGGLEQAFQQSISARECFSPLSARGGVAAWNKLFSRAGEGPPPG